MAQNGCSWALKWLKIFKLGSRKVKNEFNAPKAPLNQSKWAKKKVPKGAKNGHFGPFFDQNRPKMAQIGCSRIKKWLKSLKLGFGRGKNGFSAPKNGRTPYLRSVPPLLPRSSLTSAPGGGLKIGPPLLPRFNPTSAQEGGGGF